MLSATVESQSQVQKKRTSNKLPLLHVGICSICQEKMKLQHSHINYLMVNILLRKIFRENPYEAISLAEIASFRFSAKIFFKRKLALINVTLRLPVTDLDHCQCCD